LVSIGLNILKINTNTAANKFLTTHSGEPVWPVRNEEELNALKKTAEIFSFSIEQTDGIPNRSVPLNEFVVAWGEEISEEASLYAHLTQRNFIKVNNLEELKKSVFPSVLVISFDNVTYKLLQYLYSEVKSSAPGLIISYVPDKFRIQVLSKSAASRFQNSSDTYRVDIYATSRVNQFNTGNYEIYGSAATSEVLLKAISKEKNMLNIITHSDGIDAYLGDLTVCPETINNPYNKPNPPNCIVTGTCHRRKMPVEQARNLNLLLAPKQFKSKILVWMTCRGIRLRPSMIDPLWGLAPEFLDNPALGAVVTPWKIIFTRPEYLNALASLLSKGLPLGQAVAGFNQSKKNKEIGLKLCLLGDPRIQFPESLETDFIKNNLTLKNPENLSPKKIKELNFLRNYLRCISRKKEEKLVSSSLTALESLDQYEHLLSKGHDDLNSAAKLREDFIKVLLESGTEAIVEYVGLVKKLKLRKEKKKCFVCSSETEIYHTQFHLPYIDKRKILICPNCGIVEETSNEFPDIEFKILNKRIIELKTQHPIQKWSATLFLHYKLKEQSRYYQWPSEEDGNPVGIFDTNILWPEGPVYVTLFIMIDTKLAILRCPARG
jgi:hypothetical protein